MLSFGPEAHKHFDNQKKTNQTTLFHKWCAANKVSDFDALCESVPLDYGQMDRRRWESVHVTVSSPVCLLGEHWNRPQQQEFRWSSSVTLCRTAYRGEAVFLPELGTTCTTRTVSPVTSTHELIDQRSEIDTNVQSGPQRGSDAAGREEGEQVQSKEPEKEIMLRSSPPGITVGRASVVKSVDLEECLCLNSFEASDWRFLFVILSLFTLCWTHFSSTGRQAAVFNCTCVRLQCILVSGLPLWV